MRHRTIRWVVMLLCVFVCAACGAGTSQSTLPTITPVSLTPIPIPPSAGTVSAKISLDGPVTITRLR
jgi:hypothetical protein